MSVLICVPSYGGIVSDKTAVSLFNLGKTLVRNSIDHALLSLSNESLITRGRSKMANFFLNNTEYKYLFFLDSDIGFDPTDVLKLLSHKKDIVSGAYPMKSIPLEWNFSLSENGKRDNDLVAIDRIGIGFTLIHRKVFESIIEKYGDELKFIPRRSKKEDITIEELNNSYHFFSELKYEDTYLPEDLSFFERTKNCGFQPWMDVSINLSHVGSHVFQE
jgi:hypothetical protein